MKPTGTSVTLSNDDTSVRTPKQYNCRVEADNSCQKVHSMTTHELDCRLEIAILPSSDGDTRWILLQRS